MEDHLTVELRNEKLQRQEDLVFFKLELNEWVEKCEMLEKENEDTIQSKLELCKRINEIEDRLNAQEKEIKEMKHALNASLEVIAKFDEKLGKSFDVLAEKRVPPDRDTARDARAPSPQSPPSISSSENMDETPGPTRKRAFAPSPSPRSG